MTLTQQYVEQVAKALLQAIRAETEWSSYTQVCDAVKMLAEEPFCVDDADKKTLCEQLDDIRQQINALEEQLFHERLRADEAEELLARITSPESPFDTLAEKRGEA